MGDFRRRARIEFGAIYIVDVFPDYDSASILSYVPPSKVASPDCLRRSPFQYSFFHKPGITLGFKITVGQIMEGMGPGSECPGGFCDSESCASTLKVRPCLRLFQNLAQCAAISSNQKVSTLF